MDREIESLNSNRKAKNDNRNIKAVIKSEYREHYDRIIKEFCEEVTKNPTTKSNKVQQLKDLGIDTSTIYEAN